MDVVDADVGGEPAQDRRQVVVRAAVQRRLVHGSSRRRAPRACPRTGAGRRTARRRSSAASSTIGRCTSRNGLRPTSQIKPADDARRSPTLVAMVLTHGRQPLAHQADRQAVLQEEQIGRAEAEHDERMAVERDSAAGARASSARYSCDRQRVDVADAAAVEIAGGRRDAWRGCAARSRRASASRRRSPGRPSRWPGDGGRTSRGRNRAGS